MAKVSVRGGFSDRNNIKAENKEIQVKNFDERTRVQLKNMMSQLYNWVYDGHITYTRKEIQKFLQYVMGGIYCQPVDIRTIYNDDDIFKMINQTLFYGDYDDVLTLIEAIVQYWDLFLRRTKGYHYYDDYCDEYKNTSIFEVVNSCFKREYIGYRFIDGLINSISDDIELETINQAMVNKYQSVYEHLSKANKFISDRISPDYANSIKESISAVEAMCQIITNAKGRDATLGNMLNKLEDSGIKIHGGLKDAFKKLYGYTSDANGIRHAGNIGGPSATFEEAKFMLVTCCAFINYLKVLCSKK